MDNEGQWLDLELIYQEKAVDIRVSRGLTLIELSELLRPLIRGRFQVQTDYRLRFGQRLDPARGPLSTLQIGDGDYLLVEVGNNDADN